MDHLLKMAFVCARTCLGLVTKPYQTYRAIVDRGRATELVPIGVVLAIVLLVASVVKEGSFFALAGAAAVTFAVVSVVVFAVASWAGGKGRYSRFVIAWGYTMIPTVLWFLLTSLLYVILPPPRTTNPTGIVFSLVYLLFSLLMLFWKILLVFLSLRFGLRMDAKQIAVTGLVVVPLATLYSVVMYQLGIFKVPFL